MCKRWNRLVHSPQLLHSLDVTYLMSSGLQLTHLMCLAGWMVSKAAEHVRQLSLRIDALRTSPMLQLPGSPRQQADGFIDTMLGACRGLTSLRLAVCWPLCVGDWLAALTALHSLSFDADDQLTVCASMRQLPAPRELRLSSGDLCLPNSFRLPPALTQLRLTGSLERFPLPDPVSGLC